MPADKPAARNTKPREPEPEVIPMTYAEAKVFIENAQKMVVACNERNYDKAKRIQATLDDRIAAQYK